MPGAVRLGDSSAGHECYPSNSNMQGSPDVFINGLPAHRVGDAWPTHCCPPEPEEPPKCHAGNAGSGSPTVFTNGLPQCRVGDAVNCGSIMSSGSPDVIVG